MMSTDALNNVGGTYFEFGLDLGTTYCCVARIVESANGKRKSETIVSNHRDRIFPSTITITEGSWQVARDNLIDNPGGYLIHGTKRVIGRDTTDGKLESDIRALQLPFQLDKAGKPYCVVNGETVFPEEISALHFLKAQDIVQKTLGHPVEDCIVTVPAYFTNSQRQATLDAAKIAGVKVKRLVNEPTAIAALYLENATEHDNGDHIVVDCGGGTFDCSRVTFTTSQDGNTYIVKATAGDNMLGGYDFTRTLVQLFAEAIGIKIDSGELWAACEKAKEKLQKEDASIAIKVRGKSYSINVQNYFTACQPLRKKIQRIIRQVCPDDFDRTALKSIIFAGGSSLIPFFKGDIEQEFPGLAGHPQHPPSEVVARGAAIATDPAVVITDVLSRSIGINSQTLNKKRQGTMAVLLKRNISLPASTSQAFVAVDEEETEIELFEGEARRASENILLGRFSIAANRGDRIQITITVLSDSSIDLEATTDNGSKSLKVSRPTRFSEAEFKDLGNKALRRFHHSESAAPNPGITGTKRQAEIDNATGNGKRQKTITPE